MPRLSVTGRATLMGPGAGPARCWLDAFITIEQVCEGVPERCRLVTTDVVTGAQQTVSDSGANWLCAGGGVWAARLEGDGYRDSLGRTHPDWAPLGVDDDGTVLIVDYQAGSRLRLLRRDGQLEPVDGGRLDALQADIDHGAVVFRSGGVLRRWPTGDTRPAMSDVRYADGHVVGNARAGLVYFPWADPSRGLLLSADEQDFNPDICVLYSGLVRVVSSRTAGEVPGDLRTYDINPVLGTVNGVPGVRWDVTAPTPAPPVPAPEPPPVIVTPRPTPVPVPVPVLPVPPPTPVPPAPEPPASQPEPAPEPVTPDQETPVIAIPVPVSGGKRKPNIAKFLRTIFNALLNRKPKPRPVPEPERESPVIVVVPEPPPTPQPKPRPTRADVLRYRGHLCNLRDAKGGVIWTPSLPGCPADVRADWLSRIAAEGGTHVPFGSFEPGEAYPGIGYVNPDWTQDAPAIRGLLLEVLDRGMVPVVFLDGGGRDPRPKLDRFYPVMREAGAGLWDSILTVPCGWEPVVGDWRSSDVSYALRKWRQMVPEAIIGYHGSPARLVGSSNPLEPDDQWQGGESEFYRQHGGEFIDIAMYQTPHGRELYTPCKCAGAREAFGHDDACFLNRWEDYVARIGAGYHGWRVLPIVAFETVAYEFFRGQATSEQARDVASALKTVTDKWGVECLWGNGAPR